MEEKDECYSALSTRIELVEQRPLGSPRVGPRVSSSYVSRYMPNRVSVIIIFSI